MMDQSAELEIEDPNAEILYNALRVEGERNIPRTSIKMEHSKNVLKIFIYASDINALRAAINSYMRWINLSMKIMELV